LEKTKETVKGQDRTHPHYEGGERGKFSIDFYFVISSSSNTRSSAKRMNIIIFNHYPNFQTFQDASGPSV
jgi:hypothetical protein